MPSFGEGVGCALDLGGQLGVGDAAAVAGLPLPVDRDAVAVAGLDVAVEAVVGDVEGAVGEPPSERGVDPVEGLGERLVPVEQRRATDPPRMPAGRRCAAS